MSARPRLSGRRRGEILQAAMEVIAERGLSHTRVSDVAARAGASAALVLYYFDSKDRLLTEALAHAEDRFYLQAFHELTGVERASDRLVLLIERSFPDGKDDSSDWMLWMELWSRALRHPEVALRREALDRRWRTTIADIVRDGQRSGEFGPANSDDVALRLASLIDGLAIQCVLRDPDCDAARARQLCLEIAGEELGFDARAVRPVAGRARTRAPAEGAAR